MLEGLESMQASNETIDAVEGRRLDNLANALLFPSG